MCPPGGRVCAAEPVFALTVLAQVLAYAGAWSEAMAVLGRALTHLKESEEAGGMLGTLLMVAGDGHLAEVREFMADTRLEEDLEALWFALERELGRDTGTAACGDRRGRGTDARNHPLRGGERRCEALVRICPIPPLRKPWS